MSVSLEAACEATLETMRRKRHWLTAAFMLGLCTAASAGDVIFENVRIFDGKGAAALSASSNVLVRGIAGISSDPIDAVG